MGQHLLKFGKHIKIDNEKNAGILPKIRELVSENNNDKPLKGLNLKQTLSDSINGKLEYESFLEYNYGKLIYKCYKGKINFNISITYYADSLKIVMTDFYHENKTGNASMCSLGWIFTWKN